MQPILEVDLGALRSNYRLLKGRHTQRQLACVVKANAYGLGVAAVSRTLWDEGCREFFVATLEEAIELRSVLPEAMIGVFNGLQAGDEQEYLQHRLTPVLLDGGQLQRWQEASPDTPAILHVDTGMTRLGFDASSLAKTIEQYQQFCTQRIALLMSHLACANEPEHPKNAEQLLRFEQAKTMLPGVRTSLCNSSGLFLDTRFHHDLGRPGCALYGINPVEGNNPMQPVATLSVPILQVRHLDRDETVGYGASYSAAKGSRIAIVAMGYADGWKRALSNKGFAYIEGHRVPIAGRVSMDMIALDISTLPDTVITSWSRAEFLNRQQTVDTIARSCDTIDYEIFTQLGNRILRSYK